MSDPALKSPAVRHRLPAWPLVGVLALAAVAAALLALWTSRGAAPGSGAPRSIAGVLLVACAALGCASGPLLVLARGGVSWVKLAWLSAALSPALLAALHVAARAVLGDERPALNSALALALAAAITAVGWRRRIELTRPGAALCCALAGTALASAGAALVWLGAGPNFGGSVFEIWGAPRFALIAAAERDLVPNVPWQAGVPLQQPFVLLQARAALGSMLGIGPLALAAAEAAWSTAVQMLAAAFLAAAIFRRGRSTVVAVVSVFAPAGVAVLFGTRLDPIGVALARLDGATALALVAVGWVAQLHGDPRREGTFAWRVVGALALGLAALVDPWLGGTALIAALVVSSTTRPVVDGVLPLLVAALPGGLFAALGWPARGTAPGGFLELAPWLFAGALLVRLAGQRSAAASLVARHQLLARSCLSALVVAALASSWAGGAAARALLEQSAWLGAVSVAGALASVVARNAVGLAAALGVAIVLVLAGLGLRPAIVDGVELVRGHAPVVDLGAGRLTVLRDDPARVTAAWAAEPHPDVYDPRWREPIDVEGKAAGDFAALWRYLANDDRLRAERPVLIVDSSSPGERFAAGVRLSDRGLPHEASYLAQLDLYVDSPHDAWRGEPVERQERSAAVATFFDDRGPTFSTRARLDALQRPLLLVVGPAQRLAVRREAQVDLARRLFEFGWVECWKSNDVALYAWPPEFAERVRRE